MEKTLESLIKKTQKHIEDEIRNFDFGGYFDKKPYKKIRNRLAKEYAGNFANAMWELEEEMGEEYIENECNWYLNDDPFTGGSWEEGAEDFICGEIEAELKK
jgi:hypothetical protein